MVPVADLKVSETPAEFNGLAAQIARHWRTYLPRTSKRLEKAGEFRDHVLRLEEQAGDILYEAIAVRKLSHDQAMELVRDSGVFPPEESSRPTT